MNGPDDLDVRRARALLAQEYQRLLDGEEPDPKQAAARHAAMKAVLAHYTALGKLLPAQGPQPPDLGAMRAAIAQEMPSDDDDDDTDDGDAG